MEQSLAETTLESLPIPGQPAKPSPEGARRKPPSRETQKAAEGEALAEQKAAFKALLEKQKEGKPAKKAAPERVIEPEDDDAPPKGAEALAPIKAKDDDKDEEKPQELSGARQRLALAGLPRRIIDNLTDSEVDEAWKKQEERESAKDAAIQRAAEYEKQLGLKATGKPSEPQAGVPTEELDLDELVSDLSAQFGEDESKAIAEVLAKAIAPLREENAAIKAVIQAARENGLRDISAKNRARLAEKLPSLAGNDKAWEALNAHALASAERSPSKFSSTEAVFDDSFETFYGDVVKQLAAKEAAKEKEPEKDKSEEKSRISASTPTAPTATKREKSFTVEDANRAAFKHLFRHPGDVEGARGSYRHMNIQ